MSAPASGTCCRTCRHWTARYRWDELVFHPPSGWGFCARTVSDGGEQANPDTTAVALDGESWTACLATAPEHCCSMYRRQGRE